MMEAANQVTTWQMMYLVMVWTEKAPSQLSKNRSMPVGMRKGLTYQIHSMMLG